MRTSDSSDEDEAEKRSHARSRKSKGRRYRRKRRDGIIDDTLSDAYSESLMSQSLPDRFVTKEISGGIFRRLVVSLKLLLCNMPLSASGVSLSIVLLGTLWFKWAEEILSSCKEVTFHSSQCSLPEFPGMYRFNVNIVCRVISSSYLPLNLHILFQAAIFVTSSITFSN